MSVRLTPGTNPYQSGIGTEITDEKEINVVLRDTNNLIQLTQNNELYTDLQLANGLKPTDTIPVGRTVGRVLASDGWIKTGTLVCEKTTSGDIVQILYADDGTIWINRGSGWVQLRDRHSLFVTQAEYDALSSDKLVDGNCYIIVDSHFIPRSELSTWENNDILTYLNQRPSDAADYYYNAGDAQRESAPGLAEGKYFTNTVLLKYQCMFIKYDSNLTKEELMGMGAMSELVDFMLSSSTTGLWVMRDSSVNPN